MIDRVYSTIKRHHMLSGGERVIVALSGGADSMALLLVLLKLKEKLSLEVFAAHLNHSIRGAEADRDESFVRESCEKLGVKLFIKTADVPALAAKNSLGLEECGRLERYSFLKETALENGAVIATAHTVSDCCETMLFNLTRGATLKGLCSIPPVRDGIIRPLIECTRADIEKFCKDNEISFVSDSTNFSEDYSRNKIRLSVIPKLREINPSFEAAAARCISSLREDEELLSTIADSAYESVTLDFGYDAESLKMMHPAVSKRVVGRILFDETGILPEKSHIDSVISILSGGSVQVLRSARFRVRDGVLEKINEKSDEWSLPIHQGTNILPYITAHIAVYETKNTINIQKINKELLANCLDYDKISGNVVAGSRREGDEIHIKGRSCTKSVRRLFSDKRIVPEKRSEVAVFSDDEGVIWVEGFGCSERVALSNETKRIMFIEYERKNIIC